jgi:ribosome-binding protein aMBF1 (putative translation factor)
MLSPEQSRAARAWLGWGQDELARRAKVGLSTVRDFERGAREPIQNNREAMQRAFEAEGVRFLFEGDVGRGIEVTPIASSRSVSQAS